MHPKSMSKKLNLILILVSLPFIIYLWPMSLGGDTNFLMVQGQSMLPTILPGSLVIVKQTAPYQIDDIVAYFLREGQAAKIVVHRIMDETPRGFVIQGDNNPKKDKGYPTEDNIIGKVVFATPYVGDLLVLLRNPALLMGTAVVMAGIQMEQGRRKKRKERLRRIRLGITRTSKTVLEHKSKKKPKKPNYSLFFAAIAFNIFTYVALQFSIGSHIVPKGDMVTGFLFSTLEVSMASTVAFGLYLLFIIGLYFVAKLYEAKSPRTNSTIRKKSSLKLLLGKDSNPMLAVVQFLWLLFIIMSLYHLITIYGDVATVL